MMEFKDFILVSCYFPSRTVKLDILENTSPQWEQEFRKYLQGLVVSKHKYLVLCGDLSNVRKVIDLAHPEAGLISSVSNGRIDANVTDCIAKLNPAQIQYRYWDFLGQPKSLARNWRLDYFVVSGGLAEDPNMLASIMKLNFPVKMPATTLAIEPAALPSSSPENSSDSDKDSLDARENSITSESTGKRIYRPRKRSNSEKPKKFTGVRIKRKIAKTDDDV